MDMLGYLLSAVLIVTLIWPEDTGKKLARIVIGYRRGLAKRTKD